VPSYARDIKAGRASVELTTKDRMQRGLARARARLKYFAQDVQALGMQMTTAAAGILAPMALATKAFADFQQRMANVSTMVSDTGAHMGRFTEGVRRMAVEFGESTEALAGGLYDILSASVAPAKALEVLETAVKAAKAGMTDTKTAADAITTVLNAYSLSAEAAGDVSDLLFSVVRRGKTTFAELAPQIGLVASTAASAGLSLEELGASVAVLTRAGVRTENAITAVNRIVATFLKTTPASAKAAEELGFSLDTATLRAEGLAGVFERLARLDPGQVAEIFPNIRALRGIIPALNNLKGFAEDIEAMGARAGATEEAYRKMTKTLTHAFNQMKQAAVVAAGRIGEALGGTMKGLIKDVKDWLDGVVKWVKENKDLIASYGKLALKAGLWLGVIGGGLVVLGKLAASLTAIIGIVKGVSAAFTALAASNPLGWVALGIGAVVALGLAISRLRSYTAQLHDEQKKALETTHQQNAADLAKLRRLKELQGKHAKTNAEIKEAQRLVDEISSSYDGVTVSVEKATGAISGMAGVMQKVTDQMREQTRLQLAERQREIFENIREIEKEIESHADVFAHPLQVAGTIATGEMPEEVKALFEQREALRAEAAKIEGQIQILRRGGGEEIMTGGAEATETEAAQEAARKAAEATAKARADTEQQLLDELVRLKIQAFEDEHQRRMAMIRQEYDERYRQLQEQGASEAALARLQNIRDEKLAAERKLHAEEVAEKEKEARAEAAREIEAQMDREASLRNQIARQEIMNTKEGVAQRKALLQLEKKQALAEAETEKQRGYIEKLYGLKLKALRAARDIADRFTTRGTFSARATGLAVRDRTAERNLKANEEAAKHVKRMDERDRRRGELAFV